MRSGLTRLFVVSLVSILLGGTVFRAPIAMAARAAQEVFIVNDATSPVPVAPQARPFQAWYAAGSGDASACQNATLEAARPFALKGISLKRTTANTPQNVALQVTQRNNSFSYSTYLLYTFDLSSGYADKLLLLHVRPNAFAAAADGDIFGVGFCWTNPNSPFTNGVSGFLSGEYE